MSIRDELETIVIVNDHTHIFGTGKTEYDQAGDFARTLTARSLVCGLSSLNMNESAITALKDSDEVARKDLMLRLYAGRRTTFPVRSLTRFYRETFGFEPDEITEANAGPLVGRIRATVPTGTAPFHEYLARLTNTEVWLCNHGWSEDDYDARVEGGRFRWVPYVFPGLDDVCAWATEQGRDRPDSAERVMEVMVAKLRRWKERGIVAIKSGAFAYRIRRPFAPDVRSLEHLDGAIARRYAQRPESQDHRVLEDGLTILCARAAGAAGLPVQIHVGLLWSANRGPTRIPEVMDLTPLIHACPDTTFVLFHAAYPRTDDLAHVTATMSNVRAEFNWAPFWAGLDFPNMIGRWIDMIPNDRILYGTDSAGFVMSAHDRVAREGLAAALDERVRRGLLSKCLALDIAANILRNNAIDTYGLNLPRHHGT